MAATWRLANCRPEIRAALAEMEEEGTAMRAHANLGLRTVAGWIQPRDLELAERLKRIRPRAGKGVLLSPFDPILWDRKRVAQLFGFEQLLEIFKPITQRKYGYFCLPVLAGERLVARYDLKADTKAGLLRVLSLRFESSGTDRPVTPVEGKAAASALSRHASAVGLTPVTD